MLSLLLLLCVTAAAQTTTFETESHDLDTTELLYTSQNDIKGYVVKRLTVRTNSGYQSRYTLSVYTSPLDTSPEMFSLWLPGGTMNDITQNVHDVPQWELADEVELTLQENGDIMFLNTFTLHPRSLNEVVEQAPVDKTPTVMKSEANVKPEWCQSGA